MEAILAFDLVGNGFPANMVSLSNIKVSKNVVAVDLVGNSIGDLSTGFLMRDADSFFNEVRLHFSSLDAAVESTVDVSENGPGKSNFPDIFSLFILDVKNDIPIFNTADPIGAGAIFSLNIYGSSISDFSVFEVEDKMVLVTVRPLVGEVSEPPTLSVIIVGLLILGLLNCCTMSLKRIFSYINEMAYVFHGHLAVLCWLFFSSFLFPMKANAAEYESIKNSVSIVKSGVSLNRISGTYDGMVIISNVSNDTIVAPIRLAVKINNSPDVSLNNHLDVDESGGFLFIPRIESGVLRPGEKINVPLKFINEKRIKFEYSVDVFGSVMSKENGASVHVSVYEFSGDSKKPIGRQATGGGIKIFVNGVKRAVTDYQGIASFQAISGENEFMAERSGTEAGNVVLNLNSKTENEVKIVLDSGKEIYADAILRVDQINQGILQQQFSSFNFHLVGLNGNVLKLKELDSVTFFFDGIGTSGNVANLFKVRGDGVVYPVNIRGIQDILVGREGTVILEVVGVDVDGVAYFENISFNIASKGGDRSRSIYPENRKSNNYPFALPFVFDGDTNKKYQFLYSKMEGERRNSAIDKYSSSYSEYDIGELPGRNDPYDMYFFHPFSCSDVVKDVPWKMVNVWLEGCDIYEYIENIPQKRRAVVTVPRGTKQITLVYNVRAYAISNGSQTPIESGMGFHNLFYFRVDVAGDGSSGVFEWNEDTYWGVSLKVDAEQIFSIERNIQSQVELEPLLMLDEDDLRTGPIKKTFDISSFTKYKDVSLELNVFYKRHTNITLGGLYAAWPPTIVAGVQIEPELKIKSVTAVADNWVKKNNGKFYSVPSRGDVNIFHKKFDINFTKSEEDIVQSAKVELLGDGLNVLVLDSSIGPDVSIFKKDEMRILGTFKDKPSPVDSAPPSSKSIQYRFTISGLNSEGGQISDEKIDSEKIPLWHSPLNISRFGTRDLGGDDWCTKETYEWISSNAELLAPINDVSGEHGKDLGHKTHAKGTDIDMYGFYIFPGANTNSGLSNYNMLISNILDIPKRNSKQPESRAVGLQAVKQVKAWIVATRSKIDELAELQNVAQIGYIKDGPGATGISGGSWGAVLLKTGKITVGGGDFDLETGVWDNAKYFPWPEHHDHVHLTLRFEK
ncbi:MAG: hypothetical protein V4462_15925 [Pseudomonadota bacterium]